MLELFILGIFAVVIAGGYFSFCCYCMITEAREDIHELRNAIQRMEESMKN